MIYLFWLTTSLPAFDISPACGVPIYYHDKGSGRQARMTPPVHGCTYREVPYCQSQFFSPRDSPRPGQEATRPFFTWNRYRHDLKPTEIK